MADLKRERLAPVRFLSDRAEAVLRQDESVASAALEDLLRLGTEEERLCAVTERPRFHSPALVRRLLRKASAVKAEDAGRARSLALLALAAANRADRERFPAAVLDGLQVQASCLLAEASGLQGRAREAELWLFASLAWLNDRSCDALERAFLCRTMGLQRCREGRRDEALALLGRAMEIFAGHGEAAEAAEAQVEMAWIYYDAGEAARPVPLFRYALELLPAGERPAARLRGLGGLALSLEDLGRGSEADAALEEAKGLAPRVPLVPDRQHFACVLARIAELRGRIGEAVEVLEALFHALREEDCPLEAAAVGLDLAHIRIGEGGTPELPDLKLPGEAEAAVRSALERLAARDPDAVKILRRVQEDLGYARHDPGRRFERPGSSP
ncbi:MAG: hypothetical protein ABUT39_13660 [Acidobacteriota bacterium]